MCVSEKRLLSQRFKDLPACKFNNFLTSSVSSRLVMTFLIFLLTSKLPHLSVSPFPPPCVCCLTSILPCWETNFSNHRNGFLWWKTHNERGWICIVGRMQLNKHYAAQTQWYLESCSKSPSVSARCWRLIRESALKELFFNLSVPRSVKETVGRQWPIETEMHLPLL